MSNPRRTLNDGGSLADHLQAVVEGRLDFTPEEQARIDARAARLRSQLAAPSSPASPGVDIAFLGKAQG